MFRNTDSARWSACDTSQAIWLVPAWLQGALSDEHVATCFLSSAQLACSNLSKNIMNAIDDLFTYPALMMGKPETPLMTSCASINTLSALHESMRTEVRAAVPV